jgi:plastocyanin
LLGGLIKLLTGITMNYLYLLWIVSVLAFICILGSVTADAGEKPETATATVTMKSLSYAPMKLEIHVGDSVVWTNTSRTTHTATSDDDGKSFDTGDVQPAKSAAPIKFEKAGEFKYHCKVHGKSMSGTIVVKASEK